VNDVILRTEGLSKHFGGLIAVDDFTAEVFEGEILGILGPNGAGKTTLFNMLSGYYKPTNGRFFLRDKDITNRNAERVAELGIVRTFQIVRLFNKLTVYENLLIPCLSPRMASRLKDQNDRDRHIREIAEEVHINELLHESVVNLPQGTKKLVEFARALANSPDVLLLDEPFAGLNPVEVEPLIEVILHFNKKGKTLVIIEHKLHEFMKLVQRVIAMDRGKIIATGTPKEIAQNPEVVEAYLGKGAKRFVSS